MRPTWILGLSIATALSAGCGGADQNNSNNGGSAGSTTTTTTTDTGKGGTGGDTGKGGTGGDTGGTSTGGTGTGGTNTGGTSTGGAGMGGTNTGGTGGSGGCQLITEDASKIGADCTNTQCPFGYTCHDFAGITVTHTCILLCTQDCQCPAPTTCQPKSDKVNSWKECTAP